MYVISFYSESEGRQINMPASQSVLDKYEAIWGLSALYEMSEIRYFPIGDCYLSHWESYPDIAMMLIRE